MGTSPSDPLVELPELARDLALERFLLIRPHLEDGVPLTEVIRGREISLRTARRWIQAFRTKGLAGLIRRNRADRGTRKLSASLQEIIEALALRKPRVSVAAIHRKVVAHARTTGERPPSYTCVHEVVRGLQPALVSLAHDGTKAYSETYDLIHRREADGPNAVWQADHCQLPIFVLDERRQARKPWLTIILDDYSRAIAGYFLTFSAPSAIQTALALRQAIWRKARPGWQICGIPEVLYTDHGSDFTSRHLEQVVADLKIQLVFSGVGRPRGRGKVERFFSTVAQVFLSHLPGFAPDGERPKAVLTLPQLATELETFLIDTYLVTPHSVTEVAPQERWKKGGFLPQMPGSMEQLDLLLLTVPKTRRVQQDGIHFAGMRYIDPTLAAYVGEEVLLRYDPRDVAEIRVFYNDRFLCRAICQEMAGETVSLREIVHARDRRRRELSQTILDRRAVADSLLNAKRWMPTDDGEPPSPTKPPTIKLKRYRND